MDSQNSLQLAKMKNASQEVRDYAFKMEAVKKNLMPPVDKAKKLRESCEGFESIFIQKMWEQMRATIPESGFLKGREEKFWQSMYDQELAKTMAAAGGIGLANMMYEQLSRNLRSASKDTADALNGQSSGFAAELTPAPLMQTQAPQTTTAATGAAASAGLYSELGQSGVLSQAAHATSRGAQPPTEDETDPAIMTVLNELRAAHQAGSPANGHNGPKGLSLGARPPLPPMQGDGHSQTPEQHTKTTYVSSLTNPVHKPVSGRGAVLPRAMSGPRMLTGQPVNRNLPFAPQEMQQAHVPNQPQNTAAQSDPSGAIPAAAGSGQEHLNVVAARQKAAQFAPDINATGQDIADKAKAGS